MKMQYKHISKEERRIIEKLTQAGSSNRKIAEELGRSQSMIWRESKQNYGDEALCYEHSRAQKLADKLRKESKVSKISEKTWAESVQMVQNGL